MKKALLILGFTILFGCSDDDESSKEGTLTCGSLTITKISDISNKVILTAYGNEEEVELPEGKTFKDVTCDKTLEWFGIEAN